MPASGDPIALAGYLGNGASMARAMTAFADAYADQNEADYRLFVARCPDHAGGSGELISMKSARTRMQTLSPTSPYRAACTLK